MKNILRISAAALIPCSVMLAGCTSNPKPVRQEAVELTKEQLVQKGKYLVSIMGCNDCHSPKQNGPQGPAVIPELLLSGYPSKQALKKVNKEVLKEGWLVATEDITAMAGPWGVSFSANITPDQTGIGNWTKENFATALRQGWYKGLEGTRKLLPPMPWQGFAVLTDEDITPIFTYLLSIKPVVNDVPDPLNPDEIK